MAQYYGLHHEHADVYGSRVELYARFYLASSPRTYQLAHLAAQKQGTRGLLERLLAEDI